MRAVDRGKERLRNLTSLIWKPSMHCVGTATIDAMNDMIHFKSRGDRTLTAILIHIINHHLNAYAQCASCRAMALLVSS
jgi:hypothetical protein